MLFAFAVLLIFQCLGEVISHALGLPVPGPVIGMLLLFIALLVSPALMERVEATGNALLSHLSLLFVPAGAGIVATAGSVQGHWLAVLASLVVGTVLTLTVTALVLRLLWRDAPPEAAANATANATATNAATASPTAPSKDR
jgi:holin-like protein